ncbi:MAG: ornithine carbamoyltransferase [Candidatus Thermoplasmatota archaeon]|jgi:ornithine carbamoyltransferase|nr:ornithine carbamoyltransferase [Candidatus Thermoplasmatota archaeon]MCL5984070.1 ornithine carbamoyltransferase [Candidatus Thermoplasmatota archaeon]
MAPSATPARKERDVISIADLSSNIETLLKRAAELKELRRLRKPHRNFEGRAMAMIFEKPSTRTRSSFELAMTDLGGHAVYLSSKDMQLGRGETISDTARVLSRYYDVIMYRAFRHEDMLELAKWATIPVINGLDDIEHPCQIVADLLTLWERWGGKFSSRQLTYIGDGNNVLNSLMLGAAMVGLDFVAATPPGYRPKPWVIKRAESLSLAKGSTVRVVDSPEEAAKGADALYTDVWISMGDEAQEKQRMAAFKGYQINSHLLSIAKKGAFALHDLPAHRGLEITDEVMDGPDQAIWDQAENRLHAQKAILEYVLS